MADSSTPLVPEGTRERSSSKPERERSGSQTERERAGSFQERGRAGSQPGRFRADSMTGVKRITLVAVDASDTAKNAFGWFMENIHRPDDMIVLVHCPEAPRLPTFSFKSGIAPPVDEWKKVLDEMNAKTQKLEEDYEGTLIQKKLKYKIRGESSKNPGEGICRLAEAERADLIVIGTRGLNKVRRALLGSVSEYVVRNANRPVIVVPGSSQNI